jgi:hypothetical protein
MIYRKSGSVVRWEHGTLVRVIERGIAIEEGELFECRPEPGPTLPPRDPSSVLDAVRDVQSAAGGIEIERLIVSDGVAEHEYGGRQWEEQTRRVHLSLLRGRTRALLDLGSFETGAVARVAEAMSRLDEQERPAPPRLRFAPNVTAALLPSLAGIAPPNVRLVQTQGGVDGRGEPILEHELPSPLSPKPSALSPQASALSPQPSALPWPNWYRPSYRVRPIRMPLHLRLECDVTAIERDRPVAVALLAPADRLTLRVLVDDGERAFPATVRVTRIDAVAGERIWYPYGGGSFGAEMML